MALIQCPECGKEVSDTTSNEDANMANITILVDDNLKKDAEVLFNRLGLDMTSAITVFLKECLTRHGMPFDVQPDQIEPIQSAEIDWGKPVGHEFW